MLRKLTSILLSFLIITGCNAMNNTENPKITMQTNKGTFVMDLYHDKAPKTVENFLAYAKEGFFDGTIFHRVIPGFMIQGGGFTADMQQKPTKAAIAIESDNGQIGRASCRERV